MKNKSRNFYIFQRLIFIISTGAVETANELQTGSLKSVVSGSTREIDDDFGGSSSVKLYIKKTQFQGSEDL